jgi:stage II sporulation protein D
MKAAVLFVLAMGFFLLALPLLALDSPPATALPETQPQTFSALPPQIRQGQAQAPEPAPEPARGLVDAYGPPEGTPEKTLPALEGAGSFHILDLATGEVAEVPALDFIRGAVAAEMPASFHPEALKAQAVAAHTQALHNRLIQQTSPDPGLFGADFSASPSEMRGYITEETARAFYGDEADYYWGKICEAADSVANLAMAHGGEPIVAAYHAISAGKTEDAANVWVSGAPYLLSVESEGDPLAPGYESEATFTVDEANDILEAAYPAIDLSHGAAGWFGEPVRSDAGYVTEIEVGGIGMHGKEIRELFDLRSHNFEVSLGEEGFTFHVTGYGHGVGLSQYGADYMAENGAGYAEILAAYYTGAELVQLTINS